MFHLIRLLTLLPMLCALLAAQGGPTDQPKSFDKTFGVPGETGSFRVGFSRVGAGVNWMQALDHYASVEKLRHEPHDSGDYLLLVDDNNHALRLFQAPSDAFPVDPATALWTSSDVDGGVKFTLDGGAGLVLEKVYRHDPKARGFTVELTLRNESSDASGTLPFTLNTPALVNGKQASLFGDVAVAIAAPLEGDPQFVRPDPNVRPRPALDVAPQNLSFVGSTNRFFGAFLHPTDDAARAALTQFEVQTMVPAADSDRRPSAQVLSGLSLAIPRKDAATTLTYGVYVGPKSYRVFDTLPDPELYAPILEVDLNPPCCIPISIPGAKFMAKTLLWLLGIFHGVLGNWGFAIILLTILVRGAMFPLNFRMQKSMRAYGAKMAKLKPQLDALKQKHADDQKAYQQAMIAFQRENKIMPPIGGCLPIFLTMPIYLGLFTALRTAYDLRHQPFVGWIDDLSRADAMLQLGFWPDELNLLPLLWIGLFVFMTLRQPLPTDPQQRQMQMMMRFMPMMFGVMLYTYASALLLYMVTSMLWSLVEQRIVKKVLGPMDPNSGMMAPTPM